MDNICKIVAKVCRLRYKIRRKGSEEIRVKKKAKGVQTGQYEQKRCKLARMDATNLDTRRKDLLGTINY